MHTRPSFSTNTKPQAAFFSLFGVLLTVFFLLTACNENTDIPDSRQLLNQARDAMKQVNSYHFTLTTDHAGTAIGTDVQIQKADGDVLAPDKIQAKGLINLQGFTAQLSIVAIGDQQYYTDPITGRWRPTSSVVDPRKFADPQAGVGALLGNIQQPNKATDSTVDGQNCWSITGQLSTQYIAGIIGTSAPKNANVNTTVCIGKSDHRPYQIQINGIVTQSDTPQTTRTIKFSKFNETITIAAPQ